ncbi:MAG: DNA methyltransferase [Peptostreptococcales bacterium]
MSNQENIEKLRLLLKDLFQFENNDLDFGIYRIINIKREEIESFIDKELFDIIKEEIKTLENSSELQKRLEDLKKDIENTFGCNIEDAKKKYIETPKLKDYLLIEKEVKLAEKENEIEDDIYDNIINFFSRYYDKGDFISKRRYSKNNKYAIPYNGEEVYLYWANNDQYYIKTTENFYNYSFKPKEIKVNFEVFSDEVDVEKNNVKETDKKYFIFHNAEYNIDKKELKVQFGYRPLKDEEEKEISQLTTKKKISQDDANVYNLNKINNKIGLYGLAELQSKHIKMDGEKSEKSELEWHLNKYTAKNTSDYFIHKNLNKFLSQELDFYIKNEILHIDDIGQKEDFNVNLNKIKVFKKISTKIIEFLSQIEEFQKRLWEKKKFVINTDYCITLDHIDEKYYPIILSNKEQLQEWRDLFSFDIQEKLKEFKGNINNIGKKEDELRIELLKNNPTLVIDTKFYDIDFKYQILSEIDNLDENTNGILINSDNFQALNLLLNKYKEKVKCCYIDPPYNTGNDGFLYKDTFKSSSWLSFIYDRILFVSYLLKRKGTIFISIANNAKYYFESYKLNLITNTIYPKRFGELVWKRRSGSGSNTIFDVTEHHEYVLAYGFDQSKLFKNLLSQEKLKEYTEKDSKGIYRWNDVVINQYTKFSRPNLYYYVIFDKIKKKIYFEERNTSENELKIYPSDTGKSVFFCDKNSMEQIYNRGILKVEERNSKYYVKIKKYLYDLDGNVDGNVLKSILHENKIPSEVKGTSQGTSELKDLFSICPFKNPKPTNLMKLIQQVSLNKTDSIIDFFAGSGTTGHAVLKLNKEDEGNRKFILVEMGQYFDTVLKPRILKVIYSDNWKDGKPQDNNGSKKQIIKYQYLEQYEDSLNNIDFKESNTLAKESKDYKIKYMLEFESKDNNVFLNLDALDDPFNYKLVIESNNVKKEVSVDLVETFNYIAGIEVRSIKKLKNDLIYYIVVKGKKEERNVIIIWRNKNNNFDPVKDKDFILKEIIKEEYDEILVNGNSLVPNAKSIDEIFKANMFRG